MCLPISVQDNAKNKTPKNKTKQQKNQQNNKTTKQQKKLNNSDDQKLFGRRYCFTPIASSKVIQPRSASKEPTKQQNN